MLWGLVYDFMAFCSFKYADAIETTNTKIRDSRMAMASEILVYSDETFTNANIKKVFLAIARSSNGIPVNENTVQIIVDSDDDDSDDNDDDNESDEEQNLNIIEPQMKRHCSRMSVYRSVRKHNLGKRAHIVYCSLERGRLVAHLRIKRIKH